MARLSKVQTKAHQQAERLLEKDVLTDDDKEFVLLNWQESARHINGVHGAFFTPPGLASDFSLSVEPGKIIDLCAGIGALSYAVHCRHRFGRWIEGKNGSGCEFVCVEMNPDYVKVGKKIIPEATWICGDIFDALPRVRNFDTAISNPPFGNIATGAKEREKYTGGEFELRVIELASTLARFGAFILPQMSCPFEYSGKRNYAERESAKYEKFRRQTGIEIAIGVSVDTAFYKDDWKGVKPVCEIAVAEFEGP